MNPVNDYLGPLLRRALAPLVERGFVEFAYGGAGAHMRASGPGGSGRVVFRPDPAAQSLASRARHCLR